MVSSASGGGTDGSSGAESDELDSDSDDLCALILRSNPLLIAGKHLLPSTTLVEVSCEGSGGGIAGREFS